MDLIKQIPLKLKIKNLLHIFFNELWLLESISLCYYILTLSPSDLSKQLYFKESKPKVIKVPNLILVHKYLTIQGLYINWSSVSSIPPLF